jgi:hypothetical protein
MKENNPTKDWKNKNFNFIICTRTKPDVLTNKKDTRERIRWGCESEGVNLGEREEQGKRGRER